MISFIIPAYNEERLIGQTLAAIKQAAEAPVEPVEPFEIVAGDALSQ